MRVVFLGISMQTSVTMQAPAVTMKSPTEYHNLQVTGRDQSPEQTEGKYHFKANYNCQARHARQKSLLNSPRTPLSD